MCVCVCDALVGCPMNQTDWSGNHIHSGISTRQWKFTSCLFWRAFDWQMLRAKWNKKKMHPSIDTHTHMQPTCISGCLLPYHTSHCYLGRSSALLFIATSTKMKKWIFTQDFLFRSFEFFFQFSRSTRKKVSLTSWPGYSYRCQQNLFSKGYRVWNSLKIHIECERSEWSDKGKMHSDERQKVESTRAWGQREKERPPLRPTPFSFPLIFVLV